MLARSRGQSCSLLHIYDSKRSKDVFMHITWQTYFATFSYVPRDSSREEKRSGVLPVMLFGKTLNDGGSENTVAYCIPCICVHTL